MKPQPNNEPTASRMQLVLTAIVAALSLGVGVTGTMLWLQTRPTSPSSQAAPAPSQGTSSDASQVTPPVALPQGVSVPQNLSVPMVHTPPAALTAGMTPPQAALALGNWHYDHEQWSLAVQQYRRAITGGINNPNVRTDLGNALRFSNQPQKALEQYQIAQKMDPTHEQSLFNQGALYAASLNNRKKGIEMWQAYIQRFPNGPSVEAARALMAQAQKAG